MYQKLILVGNLGRDPEMQFSADGKPVTRFSVAVSTKKDETAWFRVTVWGGSAEACSQYLRKGSKVLVEGRLQFDPATGGPKVFDRSTPSPVSGDSKGANFEMWASQVVFLSTRQDAQEEVSF